jgi:hypothetical protein
MTQSAFDLKFVEQIERWIREASEVFVVIVDPNGYERIYYGIISDLEQLTTAVSGLPPKAEITVIKGKQLPLRGIVDETFLQRALSAIDDPEDFLLLSLEGDDFLEREVFHGDHRWELEAIFDNFAGQMVAFGKLPQWFEPESVESIRARIPVPPLREIRVELVELGIGEKALDEYPSHGRRTKLGGEPTWIHGDDTPICPSCDNEMTFVGQIDSFDHVERPASVESKAERGDATEVYMFGDVGIIYVFFCFDCNETKSIFQCY